MPEVPWNRIAARCAPIYAWGWPPENVYAFSDRPLRDSPLFTGARATLALASVLALMATGAGAGSGRRREWPDRASPMVQATANGIQRRAGDRAFGLMHSGASSVTYTVGAQGTLGARYTDPETGNVTMTKVYVE